MTGAGAAAGSSQKFTLSGLEAGKNYEFRLYIRKWANDTVRPSLLTFTNVCRSHGFAADFSPAVLLLLQEEG